MIMHADSLLRSVLETLPIGVVVLDDGGRVVLFNEYEERLARRSREQVMGRDFFRDVAPCMDVRELGERFRSQIHSTPLDVRTEFAFDFPFNDAPRDVVVQMKTLVIERKPYACLFVEDVSARRAIERMRETLADLLVHDLKNPLAVIVANIAFAQDSKAMQADLEMCEALADAQNASGRLERMLINLLDLTRLSTGTFPLKRTASDLRTLLDKVATESAAVARARGQTIGVEGAPLVVNADVDVLRRAIDNLVENALRYSPDDARVILRVSATESQWRLEVCDQGQGLTEEQRMRVFERFQTSGGTTRNRGLGLYFVQLAARAHGGEASVDCPGTGSIFRVTGLRG